MAHGLANTLANSQIRAIGVNNSLLLFRRIANPAEVRKRKDYYFTRFKRLDFRI